MPTSDELLDLADQCAERLDLGSGSRHIPGFCDVEGQCEEQYESLLQAIHADELFSPVDIARQEQLVEQITAGPAGSQSHTDCRTG